jgi:hypothetical protein
MVWWTLFVIPPEMDKVELQGLSDKEVMIAFPKVDSYTAVLIRDPYFAAVVKEWFDGCFGKVKPT